MLFLNGNERPSPTVENIERETLHLNYYGSRIAAILAETPLVMGYIIDQDALPIISAFMAKEGWEFSGSGYFSAVYVKGGLALKVGLKPEDSGATYAAWCRANQGKAGVPTIYAIDKYKVCYVVLTDRCYGIRPYLTKGDRRYSQALRDDVDAVRAAIDGTMPKRLSDIAYTAMQIREFFTGIATFDLHRGNVMIDRHNKLVITDPLSYSDNRDCHNESRYTVDGSAYEGYTPYYA